MWTYVDWLLTNTSNRDKPLPLYADHSSDFRTMTGYAYHFRRGSISRLLSTPIIVLLHFYPVGLEPLSHGVAHRNPPSPISLLPPTSSYHHSLKPHLPFLSILTSIHSHVSGTNQYLIPFAFLMDYSPCFHSSTWYNIT